MAARERHHSTVAAIPKGFRAWLARTRKHDADLSQKSRNGDRKLQRPHDAIFCRQGRTSHSDANAIVLSSASASWRESSRVC
jgi:hypothetical protein